MVRIYVALLFAFLASCGDAPNRVDQLEPTPTIRDRYFQAIDRLESEFVERGWVVSRKADGTPKHVGDSLLWSGLALAALPCDRGDAIEQNLIGMLERQGGALVRYEPISELTHGEEISWDGAVGFWRGVAHRITCPGKADLWRPVFTRHLQYLAGSNNHLFPGAKVEVPFGFDYVPFLVGARLGVADVPDHRLLDKLRKQLIAWTAGVVFAKKSCYRVHLALQTWETLDDLDKAGKRNLFCTAASKARLPLVDHYCGKPSALLDWIAAYQPNQFEYAHQRCRWESENVGSVTTPGLDLIVAIDTAYAIQGGIYDRATDRAPAEVPTLRH